MYKCEVCGSVFSEPKSVRYNKDEYNGVSDMFGNWQYGYYDACPECGSEDYDDVTTLCDINECKDCPRCGDDCDGKWEDDDELVE